MFLVSTAFFRSLFSDAVWRKIISAVTGCGKNSMLQVILGGAALPALR